MRLGVGVLIGGLVVILFFWGVDAYAQGILLGDVLTKLAPPLAGAFAGATAAFYYNTQKDERQKRSSEVSAGNLALFRLHEIYSTVASFKQHFVDPIRNDRERWLKMDSPAVPGMIVPVQFNFEELSFLLNDPRSDSSAPQVLSDILFTQERFRVFTQVVDARTRFLIEAASARSQINAPAGASAAQALDVATFNSGLQQRLVGATNEVIKRVDDQMSEVRALVGRLRAVLRELHPDGDFIELNFQEHGA